MTYTAQNPTLAVPAPKAKAAPRPILVTGSHRSGTTFIGRMLAAAPDVHYVQEPFNPKQPAGRGQCAVRFRHWYTYLHDGNAGPHLRPLARMIGMRYRILPALAGARSIEDARWYMSDYVRATRCRMRSGVCLVKDPFALFSAPWLANRLGMNVVVLIRHPAAFASSLKRLDWRFDFRNFTDQPDLMDHLLAAHRGPIERAAREAPDLCDQAILLWKVIHDVIGRFREQHPEWRFIRQEDAARSPEATFRELFDGLGLAFTDRAAATIQAHTRAGNPAEMDRGELSIVRDSAATVRSWTQRLTPREVERIRRGVGDIAEMFYKPEEW